MGGKFQELRNGLVFGLASLETRNSDAATITRNFEPVNSRISDYANRKNISRPNASYTYCIIMPLRTMQKGERKQKRLSFETLLADPSGGPFYALL